MTADPAVDVSKPSLQPDPIVSGPVPPTAGSASYGPAGHASDGPDSQDATRARPLLSVVTPAYNEAQNLPLLWARLSAAVAGVDVDWEWIVVDDHSRDETFQVLLGLAEGDGRVHGVRLARNSGAHAAIICGLHQAEGDVTVVMAADLQDPPELLPALVTAWQGGAQIVWAVRAQREGESASTKGFARFYYFLMRRLAGMNDMPPSGADFFALDRAVVNALRQFRERNASIMALITWMGFRQTTLSYDKQARLHGKSGWSLGKKIKLVIDSLTAFSYLPVRLMSIAGFVVAVLGFGYAALVIANAILGKPAEGWSSLMVVVLVVGGMQMLMMGILGEYVWRALDEARGRPQYLIEASTPRPHSRRR